MLQRTALASGHSEEDGRSWAQARQADHQGVQRAERNYSFRHPTSILPTKQLAAQPNGVPSACHKQKAQQA
jgi:hypothetical protein